MIAGLLSSFLIKGFSMGEKMSISEAVFHSILPAEGIGGGAEDVAGVGELPVQSITGAVVDVDVEKMVSNSARAAYRSEADIPLMGGPPPLGGAPPPLGAGDWFVARLAATNGVEDTA